MTQSNVDFGTTAQGAHDQRPRYAGVEFLIDCPKCGDKAPLNGPQRHPVCDNCSYEMTIHDAFWEDKLATVEDCHHELEDGQKSQVSYLGSGIKMIYGPGPVQCAECQAPLPVDTIQPGQIGHITCVSCGAKSATYPPPPWLTEMYPSCRQIYGGEPDKDQPGGAITPEDPEASQKPVAMSCPQCGAGLSFTSAEQRLVPCQYCGADVYLPDAIWRRLHPVKRAERWYLRFEGPSKNQLERISKREEENKHLQRIANEGITQGNTSNNGQVFWAIILVLGAVGVPLFIMGRTFLASDESGESKAPQRAVSANENNQPSHRTEKAEKIVSSHTRTPDRGAGSAASLDARRCDAGIAALFRGAATQQTGSPRPNPPTGGVSGGELVIKPKIKGHLQAKGPRVGTWTLTPEQCTSGENKGYFGVRLFDNEVQGWARVIKKPSGAMEVVVPMRGKGENPKAVIHLRDCKVLKGEVEQTNKKINHRWIMRGWLEIDCPLRLRKGKMGKTGKRGKKERVWGKVVFDNCH